MVRCIRTERPAGPAITGVLEGRLKAGTSVAARIRAYGFEDADGEELIATRDR
ncbi:hypothetical protein [Streptomyces luteolifulvus]|uniref:hypothetical protein n=1 Tax=Streptomyces luteolifulvus TaxID=2615112 RepID=UPI0017842279|nr:hypothetical protein [Streptomyces luteolifulvus]